MASPQSSHTPAAAKGVANSSMRMEPSNPPRPDWPEGMTPGRRAPRHRQHHHRARDGEPDRREDGQEHRGARGAARRANLEGHAIVAIPGAGRRCRGVGPVLARSRQIALRGCDGLGAKLQVAHDALEGLVVADAGHRRELRLDAAVRAPCDVGLDINLAERDLGPATRALGCHGWSIGTVRRLGTPRRPPRPRGPGFRWMTGPFGPGAWAADGVRSRV